MSITKEILVAALQKLDVANPGHWVKGNANPKIVSVYADAEVSAAQIADMFPGLTKETFATYFQEPAANNVESATTEAPLGENTETDNSVTSVSAGEIVDDSQDQQSDIAEQLLALDRDIAEGRNYIDEANKHLEKLIAQRDQLILQSRDGGTGINRSANSEYLAAQQRNLEARAKQATAFKESGLTAKMLKGLMPSIAPIDQAFKSRPR